MLFLFLQVYTLFNFHTFQLKKSSEVLLLKEISDFYTKNCPEFKTERILDIFLNTIILKNRLSVITYIYTIEMSNKTLQGIGLKKISIETNCNFPFKKIFISFQQKLLSNNFARNTLFLMEENLKSLFNKEYIVNDKNFAMVGYVFINITKQKYFIGYKKLYYYITRKERNRKVIYEVYLIQERLLAENIFNLGAYSLHRLILKGE